jgi:hypothetical protein
MAALALSAPLCMVAIDNACAWGWDRGSESRGWGRKPYRSAYSYRSYRSAYAYPPRLYGYSYGYGRVYGYAPVYGYGPASNGPGEAANRMAPIYGYGPGYAPEFGAGYYSPSVKMGSASWWREPGRRR